MGNMTNDYFLDNVSSASGREECAAALEEVIKIKLEEVSFTPKILPPENLSLAETYQDEKTNTRYILVPRRLPSTTAMSIPFMGELETQYIKDDRFRVNFYWLETPKKTMDIKELENLQVPIEQWVQENQALEIDKLIDQRFIDSMQAIVDDTGQLVEEDAPGGYVTNDNLVSLKQMHHNQEVPIGVMLMSDTTSDDLTRWKHEDIGETVGKLVINGLTFNTIHGDPYITTIKHSMLSQSHIWMFSTPEYFGVHKVIHSIEFKIEYFRDEVTMWTKMEMGMGVGNINAVSKLEVGVETP